MSFLNEQEIQELTKLAENDVALNAFKKVLLSPLYQEGVLKKGESVGDPAKNFALIKALHAIQTNDNITDEKLGQQVRADAQAMRYIELSFQEINKFKNKEETKGEEGNPAR